MNHKAPSGYLAGNILLYSLSVAPHLLCPRLLQVPSILLYLGEISQERSVVSRIENNLSLTMHVVNPFFLHRSPLLKQIIICPDMSSLLSMFHLRSISLLVTELIPTSFCHCKTSSLIILFFIFLPPSHSYQSEDSFLTHQQVLNS